MVDESDRYNIRGGVDFDDDTMERWTVDQLASAVGNLCREEIEETNRMYSEYPDDYSQRVADKNNRLYEATSYHLCEKKGGNIRATDKGAHAWVASGLALAMSRGYYCARAELTKDRGNPIDVRDTYEHAERTVALWFLPLRNLEVRDIERENNIQRNGEEERDLAAIKERILKEAAPTAK